MIMVANVLSVCDVQADAYARVTEICTTNLTHMRTQRHIFDTHMYVYIYIAIYIYMYTYTHTLFSAFPILKEDP